MSSLPPLENRPPVASGGWREIESFVVHTLMSRNGSDVLAPCLGVERAGAGPVQLRRVVDGPLTMATILVGCFGSIYTLAVVRRLHLQKALVTYLVSLVFWDVSLLVVSALYYSISSVLALFDTSSAELVKAGPVLNGFGRATMCGEVWLTLTISAVRYVAVCHPMWPKIRNVKAARLVCLLVSAAAILFAMPAFFELRLSACARFDKGGALVVETQAVPTRLRRSRAYLFVYRTVLQLALISAVPFAAILLASLRMMLVLRKQTRRRRQMSVHSGERVKGRRLIRTSVMLLLLLAKFLCCHTLPTLLNVWETFFRKLHNTSPAWFLSTVAFSNYLVVLNSATNFLVYFWWQKVVSHAGIERGAGSTRLLVLSRDETVILDRLWQRAYERHGDAIGMHILTSLLLTKHHLAVHFGARVGKELSAEGLAEHVMVKKQASSITAFLGRLVCALRDDADPCLISETIRHVGRVHFDLGVNLNNAMWLKFRECILELLLDGQPDRNASELLSRSANDCRTGSSTADGVSSLAVRKMSEPLSSTSEMKVARRFASLIICEMKHEFFSEALKHNRGQSPR